MNETLMSEVIDAAQEASVVNDTVAATLHQRLNSMTVGDVQNNKFAFSRQIGKMDDANPLDVAASLLDFMRSAELIGLPNAAPAAPAQPQNINVILPAHRRDMGLAELFDELDKKPEDTDEIIGYIRQQNSIVLANAKLRGSGEWAIVNDDGTFNAPETLEYIRHLAADHTQIQRKWKGQYWPTTLERALGRDRRLMLYPFAMGDLEKYLLNGPDRFNNDWSKLSDDVHEMVIDAVTTDKIAINSEADVRRITHELFAPELPPYLNDLLEEYQQAKARGNGTTRYATEQLEAAARLVSLQSGSRLPFGGSGAQPLEFDPEWCLAQLKAVCKRGADLMSGNVNKGPGVFRSLKTMNGNIRLDRAIVLGKVETMNGHISGVGYVRGQASTMRGTVGDDVYDKQEIVALYKQAREFNIL